ncbi:hypothetical protein ACHAWC_008162 [Mediolabrus comicus]
MPLLDLVDNDSLLHILQYVHADGSARVGLCSKKWCEKILGDGGTSNKIWKSFAVARWGDECVSLDSQDNQLSPSSSSSSSSSWYEYYRHRCSWIAQPVSKSNLDLIQEYYGHDPYKLLSACILCSRTSGSQTVRDVVKTFFEKYPTPSDVLHGNMTTMERDLKPLGLNRERTIKKFCSGFLGSWADVTELHGCGAFAAASFDIFCRGDWKKVLRQKQCDRNVRAYALYIQKIQLGQTDQTVIEAGAKPPQRNAVGRTMPKTKQSRSCKRNMPTRKSTRKRKR